MPIGIGKSLRLAEFWREEEKSLLTDISLPAVLGPMPGLEAPGRGVSTLATLVDGLIVNPGLAQTQARAFVGKWGAAPLVRLDWSNAQRPADFVLPPTQIRRVTLGTAEDAVQLGACAAVVTFLLGYDEDFEAQSIQSISFLSRECARASLPLLVEVRPTGPRVDLAKFDGVVELGVSFMVEGGADGLIIPLPGEDALGMILEFAPTVPVFVQVNDIATLDANGGALVAALKMGCAGLCLSAHILADPTRVAQQARAILDIAQGGKETFP